MHADNFQFLAYKNLEKFLAFVVLNQQFENPYQRERFSLLNGVALFHMGITVDGILDWDFWKRLICCVQIPWDKCTESHCVQLQKLTNVYDSHQPDICILELLYLQVTSSVSL